MVRKILAAVTALAVLLTAAGAGAVTWREDTAGQRILKDYITAVNGYLTEQGEMEVNRIFEQYAGVAELGITSTEEAEIPEGVEITVYLYDDCINRVQLRVSDPGRFPRIAAAFLRALDPEGMTAAKALEAPTSLARKAMQNPANSYEEKVEELNGTAPRVYYAYFPNQYHDGVNWLQMVVVFPLAEYWNAGEGVVSGEMPTKGPDTYSGNDEDYEGYFPEDEFTHLEVFTTPTPEPESPAGELESWK